MQALKLPSVDVKNPLYCPSISATAYLNTLRRRLRRTGRSRGKTKEDDRILHSFARVLDKALDGGICDASDDEFEERNAFMRNINTNRRIRTSSISSDEHQLGFSYTIPAWEHEDESDSPAPTGNLWIGLRDRPLPVEGYGQPSKRKRVSFSDIRGPPKYSRSVQSVHESSFDVSVKRETLAYSAAPGSPVACPRVARSQSMVERDDSALTLRICELEDQLYGPPTGTESPRGLKPFIERLDLLIPGIRLKERISQLQEVSHQSILDFLARHGHLNPRVMVLFRTSEIQRIKLTESLLEANGLNLCAQDNLTVFGKPNSFLFLSELSLSGTKVSDFSITHIHHLPKLSTLLLDKTGISNEAVFLLISLKHSLTQLSIACNPAVDDDAVPALLLLSKLSFLSILDTAIQMPGLRRLAKNIYDNDHIIDIEIPTACERYVESMHLKYVVVPRPPLITDPQVCGQLSSAALQRNLAAHAMKNSDIIATGGKKEMAERLRVLLEMRSLDLLVRAMILGPDADESQLVL